MWRESHTLGAPCLSRHVTHVRYMLQLGCHHICAKRPPSLRFFPLPQREAARRRREEEALLETKSPLQQCVRCELAAAECWQPLQLLP